MYTPCRGVDMSEAVRKAKRNLQSALDIGAHMLGAGAEIERVEDSIRRICKAFGAERVEAFAMTYVIIVTISGQDYEGVTEIRRISKYNRNLEKLDALNALSREICDKHLTSDEADEKLAEINQMKGYNLIQIMLIYALISAAFTVFFGGSARDAVLSAVIGIIVVPVDRLLGQIKLNRFVSLCTCSILAGALAVLSIRLGLADSADMISIGNIMIFIPGVIFTSAIQEIFSDNMMSGFTKILEAVVISIVIATGFVLVNSLL